MSKYWVCFENKGEVPINAFKLLGASSKRGDSSKIGYFGTGLKYAIAVMLRQGIDFKVYSGEKEVKIGTRSTKFLEETVQVMTVNGEKTSITLDAGVDWKPWFAIREIYSNAVDEGGNMVLNVEPDGKAGYTRIFVDTESQALTDVFQNWGMYFTNNRQSIYSNSYGTLYDKMSTAPEFVAFRKGIRVHEQREHSIFDYDLRDVEINESRVAVYGFMVKQSCSELLASSNAECIQRFLDLSKNPHNSMFVEWNRSFWDYTSTYSFSNDWVDLLSDLRIVPSDYAGKYDITEKTIILPDQLIRKLVSRFGDAINTAGSNKDKFTVLNNIDKKPLQKVLDVFSVAGFHWELDKVDVVRFNDNDILGQAKDGRVLLSSDLFTHANKHLAASVLLEEIVHAKTGYSDGSRELQNYLFNAITNLAKAVANESK